MQPDHPAYDGPVQAQDSCDWCYRAATGASRAECERLGLLAEDVSACDKCLDAQMYRREPPQGWDEAVPWPWLGDITNVI